MLENSSVRTCYNLFIAQPNNTLANIFYIFTCNGNNQITRIYFLQLFCQFGGHKGLCFIRTSTIVSVNLTVMDTANATFRKIFFLQTITTDNNANIA